MSDKIPLLAVLIDADNISPKWAEAIFTEIASFGEASVRRIYGDFTDGKLNGWKEKFAPLALVPHLQVANTVAKNSSDIALVIDGMDLLHSGRVDGFCLVSSDSDFTRLASRIREEGLPVYGIGQKKTPEAFRMACRRFIFVENLIHETESPSDAKPSSATISSKPSVDSFEPKTKAVPLVLRAMKSLNSDEDQFVLSAVKKQIVTMYSDFDERTYGEEKFGDLLEATGHFIVDRKASPTLVRRRLPSKKKVVAK